MPDRLSKLDDFITRETDRLRQKYGPDMDDGKWVLANMAKITEEVGELAAQILAVQSMQRDAKLTTGTIESVGDEIADVILTTLILAKTLRIEAMTHVERKIEKINSRAQ